jgi:hypothetical protein
VAESREDVDLVGALERARTPMARPRLPGGDLGMRVKTSPTLRRLVPTRFVVDRAVARGRAQWRLPAQRAEALAAAEVIVSGTARAGELETVARQRLIEEEVERVILWQPCPTVLHDRASEAHLRAAFSADRGVLMSNCHMAPAFYSCAVAAQMGRAVFVVVGEWMIEELSDGDWGRHVARRLSVLHHYGTHMVPARGSYAVLRELLAEREVVLLNFDVPGRHETEFLGKPVMLTTGTARLAFDTGALVVATRLRRERHRIWVDACSPLDPREFSGAPELHLALAKIHERLILECPAALEDPRRAGAWEQATASAWPLRSGG